MVIMMNDTVWVDSDKFRLPYVAVVRTDAEYRSVIRLCGKTNNDAVMLTDSVSVNTVDSPKGLVSIVMLYHNDLTKIELYDKLLQAAIAIVDDFNDHHNIYNPDKTYNRLAVASICKGLLEHCDKSLSAMY